MQRESLFFTSWYVCTDIRVLGAVIGLVGALGNLTDIEKLGHAISGAFIATIFGIFQVMYYGIHLQIS